MMRQTDDCHPCVRDVLKRIFLIQMNDTLPPTTSPALPAAAPRRTQSERSEQMRERLIEAVLICLHSYGYAGTTISRIIETAEVSRGAPLHHFATKDDLIEAAARKLIKRIYQHFDHAIKQHEPSENSVEDFVFIAWQVITAQPDSLAFAELLLASQRDQKLADILQKLWTGIYLSLKEFTGLHFEPVSGTDDVKQLMVLTQWVLRGMTADRHLISDQGLIDHYIQLWCSILAGHVRARAL